MDKKGAHYIGLAVALIRGGRGIEDDRVFVTKRGPTYVEQEATGDLWVVLSEVCELVIAFFLFNTVGSPQHNNTMCKHILYTHKHINLVHTSC